MATQPPPADAVLVRRLRQRDRAAWDEVYEQYAPRLHAFAQRLAGNRHDADDLVQETFVRALPRLDQLDPGTVDLAPYLFTTLRNTFPDFENKGRSCKTVAMVFPGDTQTYVAVNSSNNTYAGGLEAIVGKAYDAALKK